MIQNDQHCITVTQSSNVKVPSIILNGQHCVTFAQSLKLMSQFIIPKDEFAHAIIISTAHCSMLQHVTHLNV